MLRIVRIQQEAQNRSRRQVLRGTLAGGLLLLAAPAVAACGGQAPVAKPGGAQAGAPAAAGQTGSGKPAVQGGTGVTVAMNDQNKFIPERLTVAKGTTVTWRNTGSMAHNVLNDPAKAINKANAKAPAGVAPFESPMLLAGQSWSYTFTTPGEYVYFCQPHEMLGMIATVTVTD
jgi:plastocyanin